MSALIHLHTHEDEPLRFECKLVAGAARPYLDLRAGDGVITLWATWKEMRELAVYMARCCDLHDHEVEEDRAAALQEGRS